MTPRLEAAYQAAVARIREMTAQLREYQADEAADNAAAEALEVAVAESRPFQPSGN